MIQSITSDPLFAAVLVLAIITIIFVVLVISIHIKMKKFLVGVDAKNIIESLTGIASGQRGLQTFQKEMEVYLTTVEKRLHNSVQSVYTVRFNPFHGTGGGGNQSFATALINEGGDGVVISSLYSREHVSVYSKPIRNFGSEHELSVEEKEALEKAKAGLK
jgi:hypothetical protein